MFKRLVVSIIDSGIYLNNLFYTNSKILKLYYVNGEFICLDEIVEEKNQHGTIIASILMKEVDNIELLSIKVLNENNRTSLSKLIRAIEFCINYNVNIINISLGLVTNNPKKINMLYDICYKAYQNNIVIFSADNNDILKKAYPANFNNVINVSADETIKEYCKIDKEKLNIVFKSNYMLEPGKNNMNIIRGNSYLCPWLVGVFCCYLKGTDFLQFNISKIIDSFFEFIENNYKYIVYDRLEDEVYLKKKKIFYFSTVIDKVTKQFIIYLNSIGKNVTCFIEQDFFKINNFLFNQSSQRKLIENYDIIFFGELSYIYMKLNKYELKTWIKFLAMNKKNIFMINPIINGYERMTLYTKTGTFIKSLYR